MLEKATGASQKLDSVRYALDGTFASRGGVVQAHLLLKGVLQDAGKQLQGELTMTGEFPSENSTYRYEASLETVVALENELYLRLNSLAFTPEHPMFRKESVELFQHTWWSIPGVAESRASVTPNPRLLQAQSEIVTVVKDRGTQTVHGRSAYHYDVLLQKDKLTLFLKKVADERGESFDEKAIQQLLASTEANGELWIDAETFIVHRIRWNIIHSGLTPEDVQQITFQVDFSDHNIAPPIIPPKDFSAFSPSLFLEESQNLLKDLEQMMPREQNASDDIDELEDLPVEQWLEDLQEASSLPVSE